VLYKFARCEQRFGKWRLLFCLSDLYFIFLQCVDIPLVFLPFISIQLQIE
jgi:hypothetical protein